MISLRKARAACAGLLALGLFGASAAAQQTSARAVLEGGATALGGLERIRSLDNIIIVGFGQTIHQGAGGFPTTDVNSPMKWQANVDVQRSFDLKNERALIQQRTVNLYPFADDANPNRSNQVQTGTAILNHPLTALLEALDPETTLGPVTVENGDTVVQFTTQDRQTLWLAFNPLTNLPSWVRWNAASINLGEIQNTTYFSGYLPISGIKLPVGISNKIDWRDRVTYMFQADAMYVNRTDLPQFPSGDSGRGGGAAGTATATVTRVADRIWDVRATLNNGGALIEFADHLVMFEPYGDEATFLARLDAANKVVPNKQVTHVVVSHHHFDHTGGLRAAVSRGLTIVSHRNNEQFFREMTSRPAPNFPDALARNPQVLKFIGVDEKLVLEDSLTRLEVYHAISQVHMPDAVFAYAPAQRVVMDGDMFAATWKYAWWSGAYPQNMALYGLNPATIVPVHTTPIPYEAAMRRIDEQVAEAKRHCAANATAGIYLSGCPVQVMTP